MPSLVVFLIRVYRVVFAPLKVMVGVQGCCRYTPTCSHYVEEAVCLHGLCQGLNLGVRRILRYVSCPETRTTAPSCSQRTDQRI